MNGSKVKFSKYRKKQAAEEVPSKSLKTKYETKGEMLWVFFSIEIMPAIQQDGVLRNTTGWRWPDLGQGPEGGGLFPVGWGGGNGT